jgi:hypothetical protein
MKIDAALSVLGIEFSECKNKSRIRSAWKSKLRAIHPDKNKCIDSTKQAQDLNEAKELLLACNDNYDVNKENEDEKESVHESTLDEKMNIQAEILRERKLHFVKNRKKRPPGTRAHRKSNLHDTPVLTEMRTFFSNNFTKCFNKRHVFVSDIQNRFFRSRNDTTSLEKGLFKRHTNKILMTLWPEARYCRYRNKRCYINISFIN